MKGTGLLPLMLLAGSGLSGCHLVQSSVPVPDDAPVQSEVFLPAFADSAATAQHQLVQSRRQHHWPAMTAAVAWRGELVWAGAAGYADIATATPVSIQTRFRLGSTSKAVTATALARAVARQQVALDTPISRYKTDLPNPAWQAMTLRQLMSHTAGLPGYENNTDRIGSIRSWLKWGHFTDVDDTLALFDDSDLLSEPGERFHYSSFDVNLASAVLQSATGQPFLSYLQSAVATPLGLSSLGAADQDDPQQAKFYETEEGQARLHRSVDLSQKWASGGLVATSVDLAKLGAAWFAADFVPPQIQQQFWTVQKLANGEVNEQFYALGWRHYSDPFLYCDREDPLNQEISYVHHGGVSDGAQSLLVIYPKWQLVVAVNINTQTQNWCEFAHEVSQLTKPFLRQVAPELMSRNRDTAAKTEQALP
ncbi:hypothetical protein A5320_02705 [Rheinheimera sp. SA_1]|uniref:serine hydrolase domain-containing protein n=1 Tax=Rheinheimera sp. SA_1 TaxID=1827365 RepID=UPI0007FD43F7|nr:serine hydrolase domain-containing protein [Rheinheimera sp. SA_1]OBP16338.1 hypothetical protein A5320_02705 [Rheinheimera sp. SA_1]